MKEKVKETLKKMGFELEPQDDRAFVFQYEGVNYLYVYNKEDKSFLMFMVHYDTEDMSQQELFKLANTFNNRVKYVKASVLYDEICLTYEREVIGHENLEEILSHMIMRLYAALFRLDDLKDDDRYNPDDLYDVVSKKPLSCEFLGLISSLNLTIDDAYEIQDDVKSGSDVMDAISQRISGNRWKIIFLLKSKWCTKDRLAKCQ